MNSKLISLYSSKWERLCSSMKEIIEDEQLEIKPTNPLLINIKDEEAWNDADIRLMFYGQETNSWYDDFYFEIPPIIDRYKEFFDSGACWSYGGQFWNGVNKFVGMLQNKYPNKKIQLVWNNIVKIGKLADKGLPPDYIYETERTDFSIIKEELEIIKPNIVLFLTGPNYDFVISDIFGNLNYKALEPYSERWLSKIDLPNIDYAFRTYHPNFLWRNNIEDFFNKIISEIKI